MTLILAFLEIPPTAAWIALGWLLTAILSFWLGRVAERRSKKEKAREHLIKTISMLLFDMEKTSSLKSLWRQSFQLVGDAAFGFRVYLSPKDAAAMDVALRQHRDIQEDSLGADMRRIESGSMTLDYTRAKALVANPLNEILRIARNA